FMRARYPRGPGGGQPERFNVAGEKPSGSKGPGSRAGAVAKSVANEGRAERVGGVGIGELEPVPVGVEGDADAAVPHLLLEPLRGTLPRDVPAREAVAHRVRREAGAFQAGEAEHALEVAPDRPLVVRRAGAREERPRGHRAPPGAQRQLRAVGPDRV